MPNPSKRMTANPAKPVGRYRPGKAVAEQESSDEESEESEQEQVSQPQKRPAPRQPPSRPTQSQTRQPVESDEDDDDDDEEGFVTDPEDEDTQPTVATDSESRMKQPSQSTSTLPNQKSTAATQRSKPPNSDSESEEESEDESEESSEESSSSEDEAPQRKFQRPTFIKKSDRLAPPAHKTDQPTANESDTPAPLSHSHSHSPSISTDPSQQDSARRLAQAELLIKDKLERDAAARLLGKKAWDDDDDLDPDSLVDDTDNLDPAAEYAAWKLRELQRLKRDREAMIAREKEIEEIERRRNLTAEEREREDAEFINNQKQEKEAHRSATEAQYMARYHHKGAFFQGDEAAEILKRRDIMGAKFEDQVSDKSLLPEYMQLRDMTKLGKKGRTRYTDLKGQDTGRFGDDVKKWRGSSDYRSGGGGGGGGGRGQDDIDTRGLDERFLPDRDRGGPSGGRSNPSGPTGANASSIGGGGGGRKDRDRDRDRGGARSGTRSQERSRSPRRRRPSRSQSPESRKRRRHVDDDYRHRDQDRDRDDRRRPVSP